MVECTSSKIIARCLRMIFHVQIAFWTQNHQHQKHLAGSRWDVRRSDLSKLSFACALVSTAVVSCCFITIADGHQPNSRYTISRYTVLVRIRDKPTIPASIGHIATFDHGTHTIYRFILSYNIGLSVVPAAFQGPYRNRWSLHWCLAARCKTRPKWLPPVFTSLQTEWKTSKSKIGIT